MTLGAYNYVMVGKDHGNSDALSRVSVPSKEEEKVDPEDGGRVMLLDHLETFSILTDKWSGGPAGTLFLLLFMSMLGGAGLKKL